MRILAAACAILLCASTVAAQPAAELGAGAPNEYVRSLFVNAYNRGRFASVAGSPSGPVRRYGPTGLIQEFQGTGTGGSAALVRSTTLSDPDNAQAAVFQVLPELFSYYSSVGVATAGYPTNDTSNCPNAPCQYQLFSNKHALFAWPAGANDTQNITVKDPYYSRWESAGGASMFGAATTAEHDITSSFGSNARNQMFTNGALYDITSGPLNGRFVSVRPPIAALYLTERAHAGRLGLPVAEEMLLANGRRRQTFEGGSIEYDPNSPPVVRTPVYSITLRPATTPVRMNLGESLALEAVLISVDGEVLTDRPVAFSTSNGRVVSIQGSGQTVTVRAAGGGTANVTATSEGKVSAPVTFIVSAPCCQIGEGAPTAAIQQAIQDAVTRNRLNVRIPAPERVRRTGAGYVQEFQSADTAAARYLIAISDKTAQAFVVSGAILNRYEELGGPAAALGFPIADSTGAGRQLFEGGALAGLPVRLVSGSILQKWAALGYENGPAGPPSGDVAAVTSFSGTPGQTQSFQKGLIASSARGAFYIGGLILERYVTLNGAVGSLGFATADEAAASGLRRQDFEGGYIEYATGDTQAKAVQRDRKPAVSAAPSSVLPGTRVRLTVSGFAEGSTVRIAAGPDPEFRVQTSSGSYVWETYVPANAPASSVRVRATDASNPAATAEATYVVRSLNEARARLVRALGDTQSGAPGIVLPIPLRVAVQDDAGNPLAGVAVRFTASPGAEVSAAIVETDLDGIAETRLRMPPVEGVALVNAEALRQVTTFSARAAAVTLTGFPKLMQAGSDVLGHGKRSVADAGAMLAASASIIRHFQLRGDVPSPNGNADVTTLHQFLKTACTVDYRGAQYCDGFLSPPNTDEQVVNLWRLPAFAANSFDIQVARPDPSAAREAVSQGLPVLLALRMQRNGAPAGVHYVVATGINADGSLQIHDPRPLFARQQLNDYIHGFTAGSDTWRASVAGVVRFAPGRVSNTGFLVSSAPDSISISSRSGPCGETLELPDIATGDTAPARVPGVFRLRACDGAAADYHIEFGGSGTVRAVITDLADNGARVEVAGSNPAAFRASRQGAWLVVGPPETTIAARAVVNAASFTTEIAPGGLITIFGSGLARAGSPTRVEIGGRRATVISAFPFQVNAGVPADVPPGPHMLAVSTPFGSAEQLVNIRPLAPVVFSVRPGQWAIVNQDGSLNARVSPARRGETVVMYGTGFGAVKTNNTLSVTEAPVSASILGQELAVTFAGLTPGFIGLYQINVSLSISTPVGSAVPLVLRQGNVQAQPVEVAIQ